MKLALPGKLAVLLRSRLVRAAAAALAAILVVSAVVELRAWLMEQYRAYVERKENLPLEFMRRAAALKDRDEFDKAFAYYQKAIDISIRPRDRAAANLAMGRMLIERARRQPSPFGQMARGYLSAAVRLETDPARRLEAYRLIIEASVLLGDPAAVLDASREAWPLARTDVQRSRILLDRLDALTAIGTWDEVAAAWREAGPLRDEPEFRNAFDMQQAKMLERILRDDIWFQRWLNKEGSAIDPVVARGDLYRKALGIFDRLSAEDPEYAESALFLAARVCCAENQFDEARRRIRESFDRNFGRYEDELMLMLIRMARIEGDSRQTAGLLFRGQRWLGKGVAELLNVVEQAEAIGHYAEAYQMIDEYLKLQQQRPGENTARLRFKAGQLAERLKLPERALEQYDAALSAKPDPDLHANILIRKAEIFMQRRDWAQAQRQLIMALTRFPFDPRRGETLFRLVNVFRQSGAPTAEVLLVMTRAIEAAPTHPGAVDLLMQLAKTYQQMGLYAQAEEKYAKVALLQTIDSSGRQVGPSRAAVAEALLGSAQCLIRLGNVVRADNILRTLTSGPKTAPRYAESVFLWAQIAIQAAQPREAMRRLAMLDGAPCPRPIRIRADLEKALIETAAGQRKPESLLQSIEAAKDLPADEMAAFTVRAYGACFDALARRGDLTAIQRFLSEAAAAKVELPLSAWAMRAAALALKQKGMNGFLESIDANRRFFDADSEFAGSEVKQIVAMANAYSEIKNKLEAYVR